MKCTISLKLFPQQTFAVTIRLKQVFQVLSDDLCHLSLGWLVRFKFRYCHLTLPRWLTSKLLSMIRSSIETRALERPYFNFLTKKKGNLAYVTQIVDLNPIFSKENYSKMPPIQLWIHWLYSGPQLQKLQYMHSSIFWNILITLQSRYRSHVAPLLG